MTSQIDPLSQFAWWSSLKHGGLLIAPARLAHYFSAEKQRLSPYWAGRLRSSVQAQQDAGKLGVQAALLDTVLEGVLQLPKLEWKKASAVGAEWAYRLITGESFKPRRLWLGSNGAVLPVFDDDVKQIGIGNGRRIIARVVEWLRKSQQKLALLTNGMQWRLIHAGPDYEAWCEWDIALWFEEGEPSDQVRALLHLLSPQALTPPKESEPAPLIAAIQDTRKGQSELSANLGERVRLAVEHIIHSSGEVIDYLRTDSVAVSTRDVYIAATRLVMRCVVVLFAEARELLPRTDPIYNDSYSLQGLRTQLDRMAGGRSADTLRNQWSAWPRLLSLFHLIYEGSAHEGLLVRQYGGGLFQPGQADSTDPILRALALFEHPNNAPSDHSIHHILELLTRAWERVPQGRTTKLILSTIDFSDLSTEYIGILYEGLLDFQLRRADADRPIVFLNLGDQPALPFLLNTWNSLCHQTAKLLTVPAFDHVIADEVQDFGLAELRLVRALAAPGTNDILLCGDSGQRIYKARTSLLSCGLDIRGRSTQLKINYRTTQQIRRFADSLFSSSETDADGDALTRDAVSILNGPVPKVAAFGSVADEIVNLTDWLSSKLAEGIKPQAIAIFARTESVLHDRAEPAIEAAGIKGQLLNDDDPADENRVALGTMHRAKGLEFKAVAVIGCESDLLPLRSIHDGMADSAEQALFVEQERNLLYVALTRAREQVMVTYRGQASELLNKIRS